MQVKNLAYQGKYSRSTHHFVQKLFNDLHLFLNKGFKPQGSANVAPVCNSLKQLCHHYATLRKDEAG